MMSMILLIIASLCFWVGGFFSGQIHPEAQGAITYSPLPHSRLHEVQNDKVLCYYIDGQAGIACFAKEVD